MRFFFVASCLLVLAGCNESSVTGPSVPLNTEFVLAPGATTRVESLAIRFVRVTNDSRCPIDVVCVTAGDAQVDIDVTADNGTRSYDLHTATLQPVQHNGFTIHLVKLEPSRISTRTIGADEYRVTLRVTR